jgi:hypothetical protein
MMSPQACYVGIDLAQTTLNIAVRPSACTWQMANDDTGSTNLVSAKLMRDSAENSPLFSYAVVSPASWATVGELSSTARNL